MKTFLLKLISFKFIMVLILVLAALGWYFWPKSKSEPLELVKPEVGTIKSLVAGSGTLAGKDEVKLKFKSSGKLASLKVANGDSIEKGDLVASLDTADLSIALQQAQNTLNDKKAALDKIYDDIKDHAKDETLTQRQTRTTAETASNNAFDSVKAAKRAFQDVTLISPINGSVDSVEVIPGQFVSPTDVIAQVIDWSEIYFDAEVDEADISKISVGQIAEVSLNSYSDQKFKGVITEIKGQTKTTTSGATVIVVRINLGQPNIKLISSLNGQVDITTAEVENALLIPIEALVEDDQVLVQRAGKIEKVQVKIGIQSDSQIQITEGLNLDDQVVKNPESYKGS